MLEPKHFTTKSNAVWVALLASITLISPLSTNIIFPALPDIAATFSVSYGEVLWSVSLYMTAIGVVLLIAGPMADRFGRRPVLLGGLAIFVLGGIISLMANSLAILIFGRMLQAIGVGPSLMLSRVLVRDTMSGNDAARVMAIIGSVYAMAQAFAPVLGGFLAGYWGWHATIICVLVLGTFLFVWAWRSCPETLPAGSTTRISLRGLWRQYARLLANRQFVAHSSMFAGTVAGFYTMISYAPKYCIGDLGLAPEHYGMVVLLAACGFFCGSTYSTRYVRQMGFSRLISVGAWISLAGIAALALLSHWAEPAAVLIPMFIYAIGNGLVYPNAMHGALQTDAKAAGSASALAGAMQMLLSTIATAAVGEFGSSSIAAALCVFGCAVFVWGGIFITPAIPIPHALNAGIRS